MNDQDQLAFLYRISQTFNSSLDLEEVLACVMDEVVTTMRAERGSAVLREADGTLTFRATCGLEHTVIQGPGFQISRSIVERAVSTGEALLTNDARNDPTLKDIDSVRSLML